MTAFLGWLDANLGAQPVKRGDSAQVAGAHVYELLTSITKKTTDGNGTVYFLAALPADAVIISAELNCDALSGATSADLGFYDLNAALAPAPTAVNCGSGTGTIPTTAQVDAGAILASAVSIAGGFAIGSEQKMLGNIATQTVTTLGAATNGLLNLGLKLWQLLGFTDPKWKADAYALGLRLNTAGSATGNIAVKIRYVQG